MISKKHAKNGKMAKENVLTSVLAAQYPFAGQNMQHSSQLKIVLSYRTEENHI